MALQRASLRSFLASAKTTLNTAIERSSPITFVVGNESADLDSLCSAVVLAYLRTYSPKNSTSTVHIPLSNLPRADLALRPELHPVLSHANLSFSDLITLSDLPPAQQWSSSLSPPNTRWLLVDHNALQSELGALYANRVVGCIDHHDDEGKVRKDCDDEPRIITKSGSCMSLVVNHYREAWDSLPTSGANVAQWNSELARLALAPILIDTRDLQSDSTVKPSDISAVKFLGEKLAGDSYGTTTYFKDVNDAKADISGLSFTEILRKDYKQWTEGDGKKLGISSVVKDMHFLLEKEGNEEKFFATLKNFAEERKLSAVSIMTTSTQAGKFSRELLVWGVDENGVKAMKKFEETSKEKLGLQSWEEGKLDKVDQDGMWRRCWVQGHLESSRKQVGPLLRQAMV